MASKVNSGKSCTKVIFREINFEWTIENFSLINKETEEPLESQEFPKLDGDICSWNISIFPNGIDDQSKNRVSTYLNCILNGTDRVMANYSFYFCDKNGKILKSNLNYVKEFTNDNDENSWGSSNFIKRSELLPQLIDDVLIVNCSVKWEVDVVSVKANRVVEPDVQENLSNHLHELKNKGSFSDVCLLANDGSKFPVHKFMLVARSPVFAAMFESNMRESNESVVKIDDINAEVLKHMLEFIYSGRFEVDRDEVSLEELLAAAEKYDINDLKILCELELSNQLRIDNAVCYLFLADQYSAKNLKSQVVEFISTNLKHVLNSEAVKNLTVAQKALFYEVLQNVADKM